LIDKEILLLGHLLDMPEDEAANMAKTSALQTRHHDRLRELTVEVDGFEI
jgi:hypothetical protein